MSIEGINMAQVSDIHTVLHAVAVKKGAENEIIRALTRLPEKPFSLALEHTLLADKVSEVEGKYFLTAVGHMIVGAEYSRYYGDLRADSKFLDKYEQFEVINVELKSVITSWQMIEIAGALVANDHTDKSYDSNIIDCLGELHERFESILVGITKFIPRFVFYQEKLLAALESAEDGEIQWVSDAKIESYHTIWFEMHEDLLRVVGRERPE
jgi:hypothetical protein